MRDQPYGYVYLIRNMVDGSVYVGGTTETVEQRWKGHCSISRSTKCPQTAITRAIALFGAESFEVFTIDTAVDYGDLLEREHAMILLHNASNAEVTTTGYNSNKVFPPRNALLRARKLRAVNRLLAKRKEDAA